MALSTIITESPVVLFLGAGASVPLGKPVMKDFVAKLEAEIASENEASLLSVLISARGYDILLSPDAYNVLEAIPDEDRLLHASAISGYYFGDAESETKYLADIDRWLGHQLKQTQQKI